MSDDSELVEKVKVEITRHYAPAIDPFAPYAKVMVDSAARAIIPLISRQANEKMLGEIVTWWRNKAPEMDIYPIDRFAREHGLTVPNEETK